MTKTIDHYPQPTLEPSPAVVELSLSNQIVDLPQSLVLADKETARHSEFGLNGAILAEITLPVPVPGGDVHKRLALVDFGEDMPPKGYPVFYIPNGKGGGRELALPRVDSRYALVGMNYHPDDLLAAVAKVPVGETITIGSAEDNKHNSYRLGLKDDGNQKLSPEHFTIHIDGHGNISIGDQSENGTKLLMPKAVG